MFSFFEFDLYQLQVLINLSISIIILAISNLLIKFVITVIIQAISWHSVTDDTLFDKNNIKYNFTLIPECILSCHIILHNTCCKSSSINPSLSSSLPFLISSSIFPSQSLSMPSPSTDNVCRH